MSGLRFDLGTLAYMLSFFVRFTKHFPIRVYMEGIDLGEQIRGSGDMHLGRRGNDQAESTHFQGWGKTSGGEGQGQSGVRVDRLVFELFRTV